MIITQGTKLKNKNGIGVSKILYMSRPGPNVRDYIVARSEFRRGIQWTKGYNGPGEITDQATIPSRALELR